MCAFTLGALALLALIISTVPVATMVKTIIWKGLVRRWIMLSNIVSNRPASAKVYTSASVTGWAKLSRVERSRNNMVSRLFFMS